MIPHNSPISHSSPPLFQPLLPTAPLIFIAKTNFFFSNFFEKMSENSNDGDDYDAGFEEPPIRRRSARLAGINTAPNMNASILSNMYSNFSDGNDDELVEQATDRVNTYIPSSDTNWPSQANLVSTLGAFIKFLPQSGKMSIAKDIIQAKTDDDLYAVYNNLVTGLLCPSTILS